MPKAQIIEDQSSSSVVNCYAAQQPKQRQRHLVTLAAGFTLVELLTVVAIIGALAMLVIPSFADLTNRAKNARAKQEVRLIETEISAYFFETGVLPADLTVIGRDTLTDPWGNPYVYFNAPTRNKFAIKLNNDFDIFSKGKDGDTDPVVSSALGKDDVVRGADGAFIGFGADW